MTVPRRAASICLVCVAVAVTACDASGPTGEGEGEGEGEEPVTVDELVSAQVSYYSRCWAELFGYDPAFVDVAEPEFAARLEGLVADADAARADLERTLANGSVISSDSARSCIAALRASTCTPFADLEAACRSALAGTRNSGETCADDVNCTDGLGCQLSDAATPACGTCTVLASVGESCATTHCVDAAYCAQTETTATCAIRPGLDAPCPDGICADGLVCDANSTCAASVPAVPPAEGAPCESNIDCGFLSGLACSVATATCAPAEVVDLGADCNPYLGVLWCQDQYGSNRCIDQDFDGLGTCNPLSAVGESCTTVPCAVGLNCVSDTCATAPLVGQACDDDARNFCATGSCVDGECAAQEPAVCPL